MASETTPFFSAVWVFDLSATTYIDNTREARRPGGTSFTIFDATGDYLYLGSQSRFDLASFDLDTVGSLGDLTWEYYDGTTWVDFVPEYSMLESNEDNDEYGFDRDGTEIFNHLVDWAAFAITNGDPHTATTVPDAVARYYIRVSSQTIISTSPTVKRIIRRSWNTYTTPEEVYAFLELNFSAGAFTSSTLPTLATVEDTIHGHESTIDYEARKSWRPNVQIDITDFNLNGHTLTRKPAISVQRVEIWNGQSYEVKSQGRNNEFFLVPQISAVKWSRIFLLPVRAMGSSRSFGFGTGEFTHPVRTEYLYGRLQALDAQQGGVVKNLAKRMTAIELVENSDYTKMMISGSDQVSVESKVARWSEYVEEKLPRLRGWETF